MIPSTLPARIRAMPLRRRKKALLPWMGQELLRSIPPTEAGAHGIRVVAISLSAELNQLIAGQIARSRAKSAEAAF